jgi:hypothetical protein
MDPNTRLMLSQARMAELHADGAANRLVAEGRKEIVVERPCREGATAFRADLPFIVRLWTGRSRGQIRRATPVRRA